MGCCVSKEVDSGYVSSYSPPPTPPPDFEDKEEIGPFCFQFCTWRHCPSLGICKLDSCHNSVHSFSSAPQARAAARRALFDYYTHEQASDTPDAPYTDEITIYQINKALRYDPWPPYQRIRGNPNILRRAVCSCCKQFCDVAGYKKRNGICACCNGTNHDPSVSGAS